ncbi:uncharacterized protein LOC120763201 isoform X1 [Hirundo rustica]|uniref:uncharacterized protein LOC120763201 isoform X1 n=1 Tax=Hirundo rustica TaxID=43150 RepID=UPI001A947908|nr:uncharacterized protein LOC120763201 isoform X1 [Hirundo rustica]
MFPGKNGAGTLWQQGRRFFLSPLRTGCVEQGESSISRSLFVRGKDEEPGEAPGRAPQVTEHSKCLDRDAESCRHTAPVSISRKIRDCHHFKSHLVPVRGFPKGCAAAGVHGELSPRDGSGTGGVEQGGSTPGSGAKQPETPQCHPLSLSHKGWNGDRARGWSAGKVGGGRSSASRRDVGDGAEGERTEPSACPEPHGGRRRLRIEANPRTNPKLETPGSPGRAEPATMPRGKPSPGLSPLFPLPFPVFPALAPAGTGRG